MSIEDRICDRLGTLYPNHDGSRLLERCKSALGKPEVLIDSSKWSEQDAVLICYPDQVVDDKRSSLGCLEAILRAFGVSWEHLECSWSHVNRKCCIEPALNLH